MHLGLTPWDRVTIWELIPGENSFSFSQHSLVPCSSSRSGALWNFSHTYWQVTWCMSLCRSCFSNYMVDTPWVQLSCHVSRRHYLAADNLSLLSVLRSFLSFFHNFPWSLDVGFTLQIYHSKLARLFSEDWPTMKLHSNLYLLKKGASLMRGKSYY